ncbi:response regulator [Myxococcota bacterium]|nr:response regulator [Myxococcota bacterium]
MATVLIVEDEDVLRETLSSFLTRQGHDVIAAASGYEALEIGLDASPDVLVADWMLKNHIHGLHVSAVFRALHPRLNTILITGFPSRDLLEESDRHGIARLLEKPFHLEDLDEAVSSVVGRSEGSTALEPTIAAVALSVTGEIQFASERARQIFAAAGLAELPEHFSQIIDGFTIEGIEESESDWVSIRSRGPVAAEWWMRARRRAGRLGWLVVLCPREEEQRRSDARMRILLDERGGTLKRTLVDRGPIVVIERDGVVRRLLVAQIERAGALCYPSDDLKSALRLLEAEPRVRSVIVDYVLAGRDMDSWVGKIRDRRPDIQLVVTGGAGSETELLAQGVTSVLRKPWRINDLIDALDR